MIEFKIHTLLGGFFLFFCFGIATAQNFIIHKVQKGDNLYTLSKKYNTSVDLIYKNNPSLSSDNLRIGTELRISQPKQQPVKKTSQPFGQISTEKQTKPSTNTVLAPKIKIDTILHKVIPQETMYGISKLYDVSIDDIKKWNNLSGAGIQVGTTIIVLKEIENKTISLTKELNKNEDNTTPVFTEKKESEALILENPNKQSTTIKTKTDAIYHQVKPKETMYSISKLYNVSIDDIIKWNNLSHTDIQLGTILKIFKATEQKIVINDAATKKVEEKKQELIPIQPEKKEFIKEDTGIIEEQQPIAPKISALPEQFVNQPKSDIKTVKATGGPMNTSDETIDNTFFALHKTAKIGSIIKVKNLENSKITYAKVIGKLPDTDENRKVLVRLSLGAQKEIKMGKGKAYMEISFIEE